MSAWKNAKTEASKAHFIKVFFRHTGEGRYPVAPCPRRIRVLYQSAYELTRKNNKKNGIPAFAGMTLKGNIAIKNTVIPAPSSHRTCGGRKGKAGIPFVFSLRVTSFAFWYYAALACPVLDTGRGAGSRFPVYAAPQLRRARLQPCEARQSEAGSAG
jgi:hypothetical protein